MSVAPADGIPQCLALPTHSGMDESLSPNGIPECLTMPTHSGTDVFPSTDAILLCVNYFRAHSERNVSSIYCDIPQCFNSLLAGRDVAVYFDIPPCFQL